MPGGADVRWVHRGDASARHPELLARRAGAGRPASGARRTGYLLGETRAMVALRPVLEARGVAHDDIFVKGYWNLGRPDRLAGRAPRRPSRGSDRLSGGTAAPSA